MADRKIQLLRAAPSGVARPPVDRAPSGAADPAPTPRAPSRGASGAGSDGAATLWREVLAHLDDDAYHQAFIGACLREQRMRFALDSYRTLEKLRPGDPVAARYLVQVAKAMEVGALGVSGERERELQDRLLARPLRILVGLVTALGGMLVIYMIVQLAKTALSR